MIVLLAAGTRGDVQPYVALAKGLIAAGMPALLVTHPEFTGMAASHGVPTAPLEGNPSEWMTRAGGQSALTYDGSWLRSARASLAYLKAARPMLQRMLASAWEACRAARPSAVLFGLPAPWGIYLARALGVRAVGAFLQPVSRTPAFPSALLPSTFSAGAIYNRLTHRLVELAIWLPWRSLTNRWLVNSLGLPPAGLGGPLAALQSGRIPVLYGYSAHVAPPPSGWPASHRVTGYWFLRQPDGYTPPPALLNFLKDGPPPLYIGFGSPGARDLHSLLEIVLQALSQAGLRAVLGLPPAALDEFTGYKSVPQPTFVYPAGDVPHSWLLPRMAGILHHGGAGTTAAGLQAGLPALVTPMAVDQFFWAQRIAALGAGPAPIPQRALTVQRLVPTLQAIAIDASLHTRAAAVGAALRSEDGVANAVEMIRGLL